MRYVGGLQEVTIRDLLARLGPFQAEELERVESIIDRVELPAARGVTQLASPHIAAKPLSPRILGGFRE